MDVYTAQYRYGGADRYDITVKGHNKVFGPTWNMVMGHKEKKLSDEEYTKLYYEKMRESYKKNPAAWKELLAREEVTLVCFCPAGVFCHRHLLKDILVKLGAEYKGERVL